MKAETKHRAIGVLYILGAALAFACMNLFVRLAGDLPVMQKVFFRNGLTVVAVFVLLLFSKEKFKIHDKSCVPFLLLRSVVGFLGIVLNFYAIDRLNIADASILNKLSPFFAILFSIFLLKEKPKAMEIVFVAIAFAGAMLVVKPTFGVEVLPALSGFASGACAGFAYACVRILGVKGERGIMTVFVFALFSTVVSLPFMIAFFEPMTAMQTVWLLLAGVSATVGQFFITAAYRHAPAKEIAVFDYAQVLFAAVLGIAFLSQIPDGWSIGGYVIIIGAAVGKWLYALRFKKREALLPQDPSPPEALPEKPTSNEVPPNETPPDLK